MMRSVERIYPIKLKPASKINSWYQWPGDVRGILHEWNKRKEGNRLSFPYNNFVFKCIDCKEFCEPHSTTTARLDGDFICDDCLIKKARESLL